MTLYIHEAGPIDAPAIVFLHSEGLSGLMWQPQFEQLANEYHCLAPDLPGHGKSAGVSLSTPEDISRQIADLIHQRVRTGCAHIVGLSLGGAIVLTMLCTVSEVVDHAIASGVFPHMNWLLSTANRRNEPLLHTLKPDQLTDLIFRQFKIPQQYHLLLSEDVGKVKPEVPIAANQMLTVVPLPKQVQSPLLIVVGQMDTIPAREAADSITASIEGARGLITPGVGHIWNLEAPILFSNMVRSWVSDQPFPAALNVI